MGKSDVAFRFCKQLGNCEIVSADSVQVYKHLNLASSKPSAQELLEIPHHLVSVFEPKETCSAGVFVRQAYLAIQDILGISHPCGGW